VRPLSSQSNTTGVGGSSSASNKSNYSKRTASYASTVAAVEEEEKGVASPGLVSKIAAPFESLRSMWRSSRPGVRTLQRAGTV